MIPSDPDKAPPHGRMATFVTADGRSLRMMTWCPENPVGSVLLLQGRGEYIELYHETAMALWQRNWAVIAFDWRGQGGSTRHPRPLLSRVQGCGHVGDFAEYCRDLSALFEHCVVPSLPQPYLLFGHSMGGCIAALSLAEKRFCLPVDAFAGLFLVSPMFGIRLSGLKRRFVSRVNKVSRGLAAVPFWSRREAGIDPPFADNSVTSCPLRYARMANLMRLYPALFTGPPSFRWCAAAMAATRDLQHLLPPELPTCVIAAGKEQAVDQQAIKTYCHAAKMVDYHVIEAGYHALLQENDAIRKRLWQLFDDFSAPLLNSKRC